MASDIVEVDFENRRSMWGTDVHKPRLLHIALRVREFEPMLRFYVDGLDMKVLDRVNIWPRRVTVMFLGYSNYAAGGLLELARYLDEKDPHTHGTGFDHISIGVPDVTATVAKLQSMGATVLTPPTQYLEKGPCLAYVKDPAGYTVELIQTVWK